MKAITEQKYKCDVCGSKKSTLFRAIDKHKYVTCEKCGTILLTTRNLNTRTPDTYLDNPEQHLSIANPYGTRYIAGNVDHAYKKTGKEKGRLLEIGSGTGLLSYMLFSRDWEVDQLELSDPAAEWAGRVFKLPISTNTIEEYEPKHKYEAVVMVEVLEHFYDPKLALKKIGKILNKGGLVFGTTPNTTSRHWQISEQNIYEPSDHIVLFNPSSLTKILKECGYKNITVEKFGVGEKNDSNLMYSAVKK